MVSRKMKQMFRFWTIVVCFLFSIVFYNEILIYWFQRIHWQNLACKHDDKCPRILLVADPQLLGEKDYNSWFQIMSLWDSDRFIKKTFEHAIQFAKPTIICFLGDILDEGSIVSDHEFKKYARRFHNVIKSAADIKKLFVPGDNDIGGEHGETVAKSKVIRFKAAFPTADHEIINNNTSLISVNLITHEFPEVNKFVLSESSIRIILSHFSLLTLPGTYQQTIIKNIQPHLIFSAHKHHSVRTVVSDKLSDVDILQNYADQNAVDLIDLQNDIIYELSVPTSSYRMGVRKMGYGLAVLNQNTLSYTVLWSVNRFSQLIHFYPIALTTLLLFIIIYYIIRKSTNYRLTNIYLRSII